MCGLVEGHGYHRLPAQQLSDGDRCAPQPRASPRWHTQETF